MTLKDGQHFECWSPVSGLGTNMTVISRGKGNHTLVHQGCEGKAHRSQDSYQFCSLAVCIFPVPWSGPRVPSALSTTSESPSFFLALLLSSFPGLLAACCSLFQCTYSCHFSSSGITEDAVGFLCSHVLCMVQEPPLYIHSWSFLCLKFYHFGGI